MTTRPKKQPIKASLAAFIGTMVEWYDFYIYAFSAAIIFNKLFFATSSVFISTMASFATFAIGLLVRPIGAIYFGNLGDKIGRKKSLVITLFLMGFSTISIGLLPTYQMVGIIAPILLIVLRILQGLAVGGEWGGAVLIAAEHAPTGRKVFFASFAQLGSPAGLILATLVFRLISNLDDADLYSYGWRIPFLISIGLLIVGYVIRRSVNESPEFLEVQKGMLEDISVRKAPLKEVFSQMPKVVLFAIGANVLGIAGFYFTNTFMLSYTTSYMQLDRKLIFDVLLVISFIQFFTQPMSALIAEKFDTFKFLLFTSSVCIFSPYLMFVMVDTQNPVLMTIGIAITVVFMAGYYSVVAGFLTTLFPVSIRYTAISVAYQFCGAVAGGLTPLIGTALAEHFSGSWIPLAVFYSVISMITLISVSFLNPKKNTTY